MWLSKKKYNEMIKENENLYEYINEVARKLDEHTDILNELREDKVALHECLKFKMTYDKKNKEEQRTYSVCADTDNIKDVTLQELASYVIDHKPIERKEKIEVTKKFI